MIIHLNQEWKPDYGGQFEMLDANAERCEKVAEPSFNRTLLFEIGPKSFHGVRPVECPRALSRKSFAVYDHTFETEAIATLLRN
jgi:Rps23 Pro-64 3,4-dihydroxylase Tpa1-like proline 4-hydroxylase